VRPTCILLLCDVLIHMHVNVLRIILDALHIILDALHIILDVRPITPRHQNEALLFFSLLVLSLSSYLLPSTPLLSPSLSIPLLLNPSPNHRVTPSPLANRITHRAPARSLMRPSTNGQTIARSSPIPPSSSSARRAMNVLASSGLWGLNRSWWACWSWWW
jgi:hypothetical protein